ncbi:HEAT repeat domain-containing protein [Vreelandella populi]|uniref:HEAT repeat domain-containing protein n=1 Tax=Vreelandella populi TaxID=2498858 RepID=A0A3S0Z0E4_9GAMM|nr:HEAT repeat domain-containing protein [Halomonas populi]RUR35729.1 HEAT repeat domain-containing protein [Halomonas populi]RUR47920.1 HEAT repeat domain-containing protein [Halomonas populi]
MATRLQQGTPGERREAARALAILPQTSALLACQLEEEAERSVLEALVTGLAERADETAVLALLDCLRSEDAALRNDAIEALKVAGRHHPVLIQEALADSDSDMRILAIGILESLKHPDVELWLIDLIEHDPHLNVCACAVDLLCEVGTERAFHALELCRVRFPDEAYLGFAISLALTRLQGADGL